jgi:hypothetical protein
VLAFGTLFIPALRALTIEGHSGAWRIHPAAPLAVIVLMASADALLNSFFFYPAVLAAGALAPRFRSLEEAKGVKSEVILRFFAKPPKRAASKPFREAIPPRLPSMVASYE